MKSFVEMLRDEERRLSDMAGQVAVQLAQIRDMLERSEILNGAAPRSRLPEKSSDYVQKVRVETHTRKRKMHRHYPSQSKDMNPPDIVPLHLRNAWKDAERPARELWEAMTRKVMDGSQAAWRRTALPSLMPGYTLHSAGALVTRKMNRPLFKRMARGVYAPAA